MTLYLYKRGSNTPILTMEQVVSYTADQVITKDNTVFGPFAEDCELSSTSDCAETLRTDWARANHSEKERLAALEAAVEKGLRLYEEDLGNE